MEKYRVELSEWVDNSGWRCTSIIDNYSRECTAAEYVDNMDGETIEQWDRLDGYRIAIISNGTNETVSEYIH